ncbi:hypothetical protein OsJ_25467 [Oryza sativa Japonica Group]|uniref:Uncharacterized protein n=1 Tax=Oryza sativa subsp. japonica TaxID=39947 RepID=A3BN46_ORYSJ|nr:hypothetical protein OsJ_25467 [Oryza sativa Japonica Group]
MATVHPPPPPPQSALPPPPRAGAVVVLGDDDSDSESVAESCPYTCRLGPTAGGDVEMDDDDHEDDGCSSCLEGDGCHDGDEVGRQEWPAMSLVEVAVEVLSELFRNKVCDSHM